MLVGTNLTATVLGLVACEMHTFAVGLVGPLGVGPLSDPISISTEFSPRAAPKSLKVLTDPHSGAMSITWSSSCPNIKDDIAYEISIKEVNLGLTASYTTDPSTAVDLNHTFEIENGGRYNVCVTTAVPDALPGPCMEYWARPLPPPHQLVVIQATNGSYVLYWQQHELPANLSDSDYHYVVLVSPGNTLNVASAKQLKANTTFLTFTPDQESESIYSYAVVLETNSGYRSLPSEIVSLAPVNGFWSSLQTKSVFSLILPVLLVFFVVCILMAAALGLVSLRHRRLQHSFANFANSHFSTRSGTATFGNSDGLDDEDSPVIRGFSDDEPLVIA